MREFHGHKFYCDECEFSSVDWEICKGVCSNKDYSDTGVCPVKCKNEGIDFIEAVKEHLAKTIKYRDAEDSMFELWDATVERLEKWLKVHPKVDATKQ
jgi:hypothetical protein